MQTKAKFLAMLTAFLLLHCYYTSGQTDSLLKNKTEVEQKTKDTVAHSPQSHAAKHSRNFYINTLQDRKLSQWCIDINGRYGYTLQNVTMTDMEKGYLNILRDNSLSTYTPQFNSSGFSSYSFDMGATHYMGFGKRWGVGIGIQYYQDKGDMVINQFHVQYQSQDAFGSIFRQIISSQKPILEHVTYTSINIPITLKYKQMFSNIVGLGWFVEMSGVLGIANWNKYTADATFDYEAIYKRKNYQWVYDTALLLPYTNSDDVILTKDYITSHNPALQNLVNDYFNNILRNGDNRYNVGLDQHTSPQGVIHFSNVSYGCTIDAGLAIRHGKHMLYKPGVFYGIQVFNNKVDTYRITDNVGQYRSVLSGITRRQVANYGVRFGMSIFLGANTDSDDDNVLDNDDLSPIIPGPEDFAGVPDSDGDGIPDNLDRCPLESGPACSMGCPDMDGDCVADIDDSCKTVIGLELYAGCPIKDGSDEDKEISFRYFHMLIFRKGDSILAPAEVLKFKSYLKQNEIKTFVARNNWQKKLTGQKESKIIIAGYDERIGFEELYSGVWKKRKELIVDLLIDAGVPRDKIIVGPDLNLKNLNLLFIVFGENAQKLNTLYTDTNEGHTVASDITHKQSEPAQQQPVQQSKNSDKIDDQYKGGVTKPKAKQGGNVIPVDAPTNTKADTKQLTPVNKKTANAGYDNSTSDTSTLPWGKIYYSNTSDTIAAGANTNAPADENATKQQPVDPANFTNNLIKLELTDMSMSPDHTIELVWDIPKQNGNCDAACVQEVKRRLSTSQCPGPRQKVSDDTWKCANGNLLKTTDKVIFDAIGNIKD